MGHCISVFLLRKEELRNSKLETILEDKTQNQNFIFNEAL